MMRGKSWLGWVTLGLCFGVLAWGQNQGFISPSGHGPSTGLPRTGPGPRIGSASPPPSYANYYNQQVSNFHRPGVTGAQFTADRVFLQNPNVSPYLNLVRGPRLGGWGPGTNYFAWVVPERERREQERQTMLRPPAPGAGRGPGVSRQTSNPYFNRFYSHP